MASFRNSAKTNATELSKHVWELKDKGAEFTWDWKIIARARMYKQHRGATSSFVSPNCAL